MTLGFSVEYIDEQSLLLSLNMQRFVPLTALISLVILAAASPTPGAISNRSCEHS
jgi:hypothetical protein